MQKEIASATHNGRFFSKFVDKFEKSQEYKEIVDMRKNELIQY